MYFKKEITYTSTGIQIYMYKIINFRMSSLLNFSPQGTSVCFQKIIYQYALDIHVFVGKICHKELYTYMYSEKMI